MPKKGDAGDAGGSVARDLCGIKESNCLPSEDECIPEFFLASVGRKAGKGLQLVSFKSGAGKCERKLTVVEGREGGRGVGTAGTWALYAGKG